MLREFIEKLLAMSVAGKTIETTGDPVLVPADMKVQEMSQYRTERLADRRRFDAYNIQSLIDYFNEDFHDLSKPVVCIDPNNLNVDITWRWQDKGLCEHGAGLNAKPTPEYQLFLDHRSKQSYSQREIIEFVEDWAYCLDDAAQLVAALRVVDAKAKVVAQSKSENHSTERSAMEQVEISTTKLPDHFNLNAPPVDGLGDYQFQLRLVSHFNDGDVRFTLAAIAPDNVKLDVAEMFREKLQDGISSDKAYIEIGTISF